MKMMFLIMPGLFAWTCVAVGGAVNTAFDAPTAAQFAEVGAAAKEVSFRTIPSRWIVDDWHRLGVKVYLCLSPEEDESPGQQEARSQAKR